MFGFSFEKLIVIAVIAIVIIGPARLPQYAARLGQLIKMLRRFLDTAKDRVQAEMGPEFDDLDWKKLDPRQYDPRKIIRDALLDDSDAPVVRRATPAAEVESSDAEPTPSDTGAPLTLVTDDDAPSVPERKAS